MGKVIKDGELDDVGDLETVMEDILLDEFPKKEIEKEVIESNLTHPAGVSTTYQMEDTLREVVNDWFRQNVSEDYSDAREKMSNKFYDRIYDDVESNYKKCRERFINKFGEDGEPSLSVVRDEIMNPVLDD